MATISFFRNVEIKDKETADRIREELKSDKHAYADLPPAEIDFKKQEEEAKKWLSLSKKS